MEGYGWPGTSYAKTNWELRSEYYVSSYYNAIRPLISSNPTVGIYGRTINISTPDAASIEKISLMRLSIFTHGFNRELRFIWLQIQSKGSNNVTLSAPVNAKIAPPGYHIIHVLNSAEIPSVAKVIKVPGTSSPPPDDTTALAATLTTTDQTFTLESPTSHTFTANDKVLVEWDDTSGTSTDQVHVKRHYCSDPATSFHGINTR